jgi:hypothetical protein
MVPNRVLQCLYLVPAHTSRSPCFCRVEQMNFPSGDAYARSRLANGSILLDTAHTGTSYLQPNLSASASIHPFYPKAAFTLTSLKTDTSITPAFVLLVACHNEFPYKHLSWLHSRRLWEGKRRTKASLFSRVLTFPKALW